MTESETQRRRVVRASLATRLLLILTIAVAVAVIVLQLNTTLQTNRLAHSIARQQHESAQRGIALKALTQEIESCTTPKGECYKRGQRQTGAAVGSINEVVILAAACAKEPDVDTVRQIQACVRHNLDEQP